MAAAVEAVNRRPLDGRRLPPRWRDRPGTD